MNSSILSSSEMKPLGLASTVIRARVKILRKRCVVGKTVTKSPIRSSLSCNTFDWGRRADPATAVPRVLVVTSIECRTNLIPKYILKSLHQPTAKANATGTLVTSNSVSPSRMKP